MKTNPTIPLSEMYPWSTRPLIINAPMGGFANAALAIAVTRAGGLGLIGGVFDMAYLEDQLEQARISFSKTPLPNDSDVLPVGIGLLPFVSPLAAAISLVAKYRPCTVWLFAANELADYAVWARRIREVSPATKVWVQVGSVAAALDVTTTTSPDVLVLQGADAGGHGFERGAGIISLLPEAADVLVDKGLGHIPLIAAGGIVDGRGVAGALALGAAGVVMGTRFLSAVETSIHPAYRASILAAEDGGQVTVRAKVFDELKGPNIWPGIYDGRALMSRSYEEFVGGAGIEEIRERYAEAARGEDGAFGPGGRAAVWAGTGVGLVKEVRAAEEIVVEVREAAKVAIELAKARL